MMPPHLPDFSMTRRRVLTLGALAGGLTLSARHAAAVVRLDVTQGNFQPLPIAIADFMGGAATDNDTALGVTPDHHRRPQAQRLVRADRSRRLPREDHQR